MEKVRWGNANVQALPFTPDSEVSSASALGVQGAVFPEPLGSFSWTSIFQEPQAGLRAGLACGCPVLPRGLSMTQGRVKVGNRAGRPGQGQQWELLGDSLVTRDLRGLQKASVSRSREGVCVLEESRWMQPKANQRLRKDKNSHPHIPTLAGVVF